MNKRHHINTIIERKLEQLPATDADLLWNDMHSILDKKMPQKKERRRFIWWFLSGNGILLLSISLIIISSSSLVFLSKKESATVTIKKLSDSQQADKFIEDGVVKGAQESKENIATTGESNQKTRENISATTSSASAADHVINNNLIAHQVIKKRQKYTVEDQFNQPIPDISTATENFDIAPVTLESIHHGLLITTNENENKKYSSPQLEPEANRVMKMNTRNNHESGFYAGIISGVDLSSIRFRSVKTGATKGFIIGYSFNQKWSIEGGMLWDTKRVYDNGSYFNPPGYTPTNGIRIIAVNGKSRLYELPVNMKYTIIPGKHSLFATIGLSSYIMRSENYDYEYTQNNQPGGHNYLSYTNKTKNWLSVANFSIGYARKLSDMGSILIEPYLKLPIKNLGVGNMPIMSTGLNIGFTKKIK